MERGSNLWKIRHESDLRNRQNPHLFIYTQLQPCKNTQSSLDQLGGWKATAVAIAEEMNALALTLSSLVGLNPLAGSCTGPHGLEETERSGVGVGAVMLAHNLLDGFGSFVSVVEGNAPIRFGQREFS